MDLTFKKSKLTLFLKERLFLRFHMFLLLCATALSGVLASWLLLLAHVNNIVIRYPLAVIISYFAFFCFVKLWIMYATSQRDCDGHNYDPVSDTLNVIPDFSRSSGGHFFAPETFSGGGGTSGGGGASGSFNVSSHAAVSDVSHSGDIGGSVADGAGKAVSGAFDCDDAGFVLVVIGIALAVILGAGIFLVYDAPNILTDAAFNALLAAGLINKARELHCADWKGSVFRATWKPFAVVFIITLIAASIIHATYPDVHKLSEIFNK